MPKVTFLRTLGREFARDGGFEFAKLPKEGESRDVDSPDLLAELNRRGLIVGLPDKPAATEPETPPAKRRGRPPKKQEESE